MTAYNLRLAALAMMLMTAPAMAQDNKPDSGERTIEQYSCKDVMRESGGNPLIKITYRMSWISFSLLIDAAQHRLALAPTQIRHNI